MLKRAPIHSRAGSGLLLRLATLVCSVLPAAACAPTGAAHSPAAAPTTTGAAHATTPGELDRRVRVFDREGNEIDLAAMLDRLAAYDAVFLGETHLDDTTHRVEHAVLEGLADRREDRLVLSLEMFERDVQPALDAYLTGTRPEAGFLAEARPWGNYGTDYRPLVETARARAIPVVAANLPRPLVGRIGELAALGDGAAAGFDALRKEHPDWLPATVHPPDEAYWARVGRVLRGHGPAPGAAADPTWSIQNLWDNTMADSVALALDREKDSAVLHVVGAFHVQYFGGTVAQLRKRRPKAKIATLTVMPTDDLATAQPRTELADFVVYAQSYAEGQSGGKHSVTVATELDWRLHTPARPSGQRGAPLLVWLGDDGEASADVLLRWRLALGDEAAVIVVEPPLRRREDDGRIGRRWAWPTTFAEDQRPVQLGLTRILEYASRRLPIAKDRIIVAGHGAGAASVLWAALYEDAPFVAVHAFAPELPRALRTASVPEDPPGARSIAIHDFTPDRAALEQVVDGFTRAGASPTVAAMDASAIAEERIVVEALGLPARPPTDVAGMIVLPDDTAVGRRWADLVASALRKSGSPVSVGVGGRGHSKKGGATVLDEAWLREQFADGRGLPRPEAAFGGATILVLPERATKAQKEAWSAIVDKAAAERGRFSPIRLSTRADLRDQIAVLGSTGQADVLVVPLQFAAPLARMHALHEAVGEPPDTITVHWLSGLGGAAAHHAARAAD